MTPINPNIDQIEAVVHRLGPLTDKVVFLGGAATGLLLTDPAAPPLRVTRDVDVIVEVLSLVKYHRFNKELRNCGFIEDTSTSAPICRWRSKDSILDVMPTDPKILGFSNRWFKKASASAESYTLPSGWQIRLVTGPCFLATKIEAFDHRGANDFLLSADIEDIVVIFDGRPEIVTEVLKAEKDLKHFLRKRFSELGKNKNFIETLQGHLPPDAASQTRAKHILDRIEAIGLGA